MKLWLGAAGVAIVAAACIAMIVTSISLGHTGNCAAGAVPYHVTHRCSPEDITNAGIFAVGLVALVLGSFAVAFGFGSNPMILVMGSGFASSAIALLIDGSPGVQIMAWIWLLVGLGMAIGAAIALLRQRSADRLAAERPQIFG